MDQINIQLLYHFEHQVLPLLFYQNPEEVCMMLCKDGTSYDVFDSWVKTNKIDCVYNKNDFKVTDITKENMADLLAIKLTFPKPDMPLLCYSSFMIYDKKTGRARYYTIEKSNNNKIYMCGWSKKAQHLNFGHINMNDDWGEKCLNKFASETTFGLNKAGLIYHIAKLFVP